MALTNPPLVRVTVLIRRPVAEVFKAFLEQGIELNMVADKGPDAQVAEASDA
jgi:uncharacterized protein YndB with AHSA1/START domain